MNADELVTVLSRGEGPCLFIRTAAMWSESAAVKQPLCLDERSQAITVASVAAPPTYGGQSH